MPQAGLASRWLEESTGADRFRPRVVPEPARGTVEPEGVHRPSRSLRASAAALDFDPSEVLKAWEDSVERELRASERRELREPEARSPQHREARRPERQVHRAPPRPVAVSAPEPAARRMATIDPPPGAEPETALADGTDDRLPARRTITITGRGAVERFHPTTARRAGGVRTYERPNFRPDRTAMWAVLLCVVMILAAASSSHAAVIHAALHATGH